MAPKPDSIAAIDSTASRKRKRQEKLQQYGVDLPDIPGLPVTVVPLHIHALKLATKYIQKDAKDKLVVEDSSDQSKNESHTAQSTTVMGAILNRIETEALAQATASNEDEQQSRERTRRKDDAVQSWLQAIHRSLRDSKPREDRQFLPAPVAALQHLWTLSQQHKRLAARRAAVYMASELLKRSTDARRWLFEDGSTEIVEWMDNVATPPDLSPEDLPVRLWQTDAYMLLRQLDTAGYGDIYPTLGVALQRFQQMCPAVAHQPVDGSVPRLAPADWRRTRDIAMECFEKEVECVGKLIARAQACMDIVVPRIGDGSDEMSRELRNQQEDEDDDIDWEDGWENDPMRDPEEATGESHQDAVERTLAMIETTGDLQDGVLNIDMTSSAQDASVPAAEMILQRARLSKVVNILSSRHMPRLASWVEALIKADGLLVREHEGVTSLAQMSRDSARRRQEALQRLFHSKTAVAAVLVSAQRLGLDGPLSSDAGPAVRPAVVRRTRLANESPGVRLTQRRPVAEGQATHKRSHRIQIKYRKT